MKSCPYHSCNIFYLWKCVFSVGIRPQLPLFPSSRRAFSPLFRVFYCYSVLRNYPFYAFRNSEHHEFGSYSAGFEIESCKNQGQKLLSAPLRQQGKVFFPFFQKCGSSHNLGKKIESCCVNPLSLHLPVSLSCKKNSSFIIWPPLRFFCLH